MKTKLIYVCSNCGAENARWAGQCPTCGEWNTLHEEITGKKMKLTRKSEPKITTLGEIESDSEFRIKTSIDELDRTLGGGIIPGSLVLVGGDPGIGKSTLLLQMCAGIKSKEVLYITGEESLRQIKHRAARLKGIPDGLKILDETNIEEIKSAIKKSGCEVAVIDSIQSAYSETVESTPGSVGQVRECATILMRLAKTENIAVFIVGHVTKDGAIAGPKLLEHTVDTVLQFEGDKTYSYRILRSLKNRFGSTNEIGIFEMAEDGMHEVKNPSEIFLAKRHLEDSGITVVASIEGTRPILLEVQSLVSPSGYSVPQRTSNGFDTRRLQMILAVLEKRLGAQFIKNDVFVNVAGGVYLNDTSVDLGIAASLYSSLIEKPADAGTVIIGEIGLTGEIRAVPHIEQRIREAEKLGFVKAVLPQQNFEKLNSKFKIELKPFERISSAFAEIF